MGRVTKTTKVVDALLDVLVVGGLIGATIVAPNAIQIIGKTHLKMDKHRRNRELNRVMHYMKRQGVIVINEIGDKSEISITEKGKKRVARMDFENMPIPSAKRWDGKWRIVKEKLEEIGFKMLQKSVWVHPYPSREQIELIKYVYPEIASHIVYLETDNVDNHNQLVQQFRQIITE